MSELWLIVFMGLFCNACNDSGLSVVTWTGGDGEAEEGLLCEEDGTVTVRDSLDALLQVRRR